MKQSMNLFVTLLKFKPEICQSFCKNEKKGHRIPHLLSNFISLSPNSDWLIKGTFSSLRVFIDWCCGARVAGGAHLNTGVGLLERQRIDLTRILFVEGGERERRDTCGGRAGEERQAWRWRLKCVASAGSTLLSYGALTLANMKIIKGLNEMFCWFQSTNKTQQFCFYRSMKILWQQTAQNRNIFIWNRVVPIHLSRI